MKPQALKQLALVIEEDLRLCTLRRPLRLNVRLPQYSLRTDDGTGGSADETEGKRMGAHCSIATIKRGGQIRACCAKLDACTASTVSESSM